MQAVAGEKIRGFGVVHFRQFGFYLAAHRGRRGVGAMRNLVEFVTADGALQIVAQRCALADIERIEDWLLGEKHEALDEFLFFRRHVEFAEGLFFFE